MRKAIPRKKLSSVFAVLTSFLILSCSTPTSDPLIVAVPGFLDVLNANAVPGASYAVIQNNQIVELDHYGIIAYGQNDTLAANTRFQASVISQFITAITVLKLIDDGEFGLSDEVNDYLTSWQVPDNSFSTQDPVSIEGLLRHTAGINNPYFFGYVQDEDLYPTLSEILIGGLAANNTPIEADTSAGNFIFSSGGFMILQQLLEDIEGRAFEEMIQEYIFDELNMGDSFYEVPGGLLSNELAYGHDTFGTTAPSGYFYYPEYAAQGLWSTPNDLAKLLVELQNTLRGQSSGLVSQNLFDDAISTTASSQYGLGFAVYDVNGERYFGHGDVGLSGKNEGYFSLMISHESSGDGAVIMTNGNNGEIIVNEILDDIVEEYGWPGF